MQNKRTASFWRLFFIKIVIYPGFYNFCFITYITSFLEYVNETAPKWGGLGIEAPMWASLAVPLRGGLYLFRPPCAKGAPALAGGGLSLHNPTVATALRHLPLHRGGLGGIEAPMWASLAAPLRGGLYLLGSLVQRGLSA